MLNGDLLHDFLICLVGVILAVCAIAGLSFLIVRYRSKIQFFLKNCFRISTISRLPVILWIGAIIYFCLKLHVFYGEKSVLFHIALTTAALVLIAFNVKLIRMKDGVRTAALIEFLGKPVRSGSGLMFVWQPLPFVQIERITATEVLGENPIDEKIVAETADEEVVPLDYAGEYRILPSGLVNALKFGKNLKDMINQRLRSLLSGEVRKRAKDDATGKTGRDRVHDEKDEIAKAVEKEFMEKHAERYGVVLIFHIDDPELPPKLAEKEIEREVQAKENERRELEVDNLNNLAKKAVAEADSRGEKLTFQQARKDLLVALKIVPETREIKGLDEGTLELVRDVLPAILNLRDKGLGKP